MPLTDVLNAAFRAPSHDYVPDTWGSKINDCARRLDAMDLPQEAAEVLRELFAEIGRLTKAAGRR